MGQPGPHEGQGVHALGPEQGRLGLLQGPGPMQDPVLEGSPGRLEVLDGQHLPDQEQDHHDQEDGIGLPGGLPGRPGQEPGEHQDGDDHRHVGQQPSEPGLGVDRHQGLLHRPGGPGRQSLEQGDGAGQDDPGRGGQDAGQTREGPAGDGRQPGQPRGRQPAQGTPSAVGVVRGHEHQAASEQRHVQVGHQDPESHALGGRPEGRLDAHHPEQEEQGDREDQGIQDPAPEPPPPFPAPGETQDPGQDQEPRDQPQVAGQPGHPIRVAALEVEQGEEEVRHLQEGRGGQEPPGHPPLSRGRPGPVGQAPASQGLQEQVPEGPDQQPPLGPKHQMDRGHQQPGAHQNDPREPTRAARQGLARGPRFQGHRRIQGMRRGVWPGQGAPQGRVLSLSGIQAIQ